MKTISIVGASLLLILLASCATGSFPGFPSTIKFHYVTDVRVSPLPTLLTDHFENAQDIPQFLDGQDVRCLKFDIVSAYPYKIKYNSEVSLLECSGVGGYKPMDAVSLYDWMDDVAKWAEGRRKCFK